jgi:hypothetical protein
MVWVSAYRAPWRLLGRRRQRLVRARLLPELPPLLRLLAKRILVELRVLVLDDLSAATCTAKHCERFHYGVRRNVREDDAHQV